MQKSNLNDPPRIGRSTKSNIGRGRHSNETSRGRGSGNRRRGGRGGGREGRSGRPWEASLNVYDASTMKASQGTDTTSSSAANSTPMSISAELEGALALLHDDSSSATSRLSQLLRVAVSDHARAQKDGEGERDDY